MRGMVMGLKQTKERIQASPVYLLKNLDREFVEMAQDHDGNWWFRHKTTELVYRKGIGRDFVRKWEPWYCPEVQPDPYHMPGPRATRLQGEVRYLPIPTYK